MPPYVALRRRLVEGWGEAIRGLGGGGKRWRTHPPPEVVAEIEPEELRALQFSRAKADYLVGLAREVVAGGLALEELGLGTVTAAKAAFLGVRGLGRWSAGYVLLRGLGAADAVPVGDAGLAVAIQRLKGLDHRATPAEQEAWLAPYAPYRGFAVHHLWETLVKTHPSAPR